MDRTKRLGYADAIDEWIALGEVGDEELRELAGFLREGAKDVPDQGSVYRTKRREAVERVLNHEDRLNDLERRIDGCALANVVFRELADLNGRVVMLECWKDLSEDERGAFRSVGEVLKELVFRVGAHQVRECLKAEPEEQQAQLVEPLGAVRRALRRVREIEEMGGALYNLDGDYQVVCSNSGEYGLRHGGTLKVKSPSPAGILLAWVRETGRVP